MKELIDQISTMLKKLRSERGWSLDVASHKTGVSKAMLGQIERGESSPTIATLWKIAAGFKTSFSSFVEQVDFSQRQETIYRKGELQHMHPEDDKIRVMPIFPYDPLLKFEVFVIELLPGCTHLSPPHQRGMTEHIIVTHGKIEVLIGGEWQPVGDGDGIRFAADQSHGYRNLSDQRAVFHDMLHYL